MQAKVTVLKETDSYLMTVHSTPAWLRAVQYENKKWDFEVRPI